jgi:hypothetical protein
MAPTYTRAEIVNGTGWPADARFLGLPSGDAGDGEYRPAYNGHPNRETWNAALWIGNDEPMYHAANGIVRRAFMFYTEPALLADARAHGTPNDRARWRRDDAVHEAADQLAEWYAQAIEAPTEGPLADIVNYALAWVDWHDIARDIADALALPDPEP